MAEAGTTLAAAHKAAAAVHAELGIDIAARDSATLGGMVATNAGGIHVIRYGPMRARLGGLEVVLADGTVASRLSGLVKDNVGYDLAQIMAGSEGTLGVVTKVALHLVAVAPLLRGRPDRLAQCRRPGSRPADKVRSACELAVALSTRLRQRVDGIDALELVFADGMALVREVAGLPAPPDPGAEAWLLVEASGGQDPTAMLAEAVEDGARGERDRRRRRTAGPGAPVGLPGAPHRGDRDLGRAAQARRDASPRPPRRVRRFGATGHLAALGARPKRHPGHLVRPRRRRQRARQRDRPEPEDHRADDAVFGMVIDRGGSISAEHGVGIAKLDFVTAARTPGDLTVMRRVKGALDPAGILNPGVLLPA